MKKSVLNAVCLASGLLFFGVAVAQNQAMDHSTHGEHADHSNMPRDSHADHADMSHDSLRSGSEMDHGAGHAGHDASHQPPGNGGEHSGHQGHDGHSMAPASGTGGGSHAGHAGHAMPTVTSGSWAYTSRDNPEPYRQGRWEMVPIPGYGHMYLASVGMKQELACEAVRDNPRVMVDRATLAACGIASPQAARPPARETAHAGH